MLNPLLVIIQMGAYAINMAALEILEIILQGNRQCTEIILNLNMFKVHAPVALTGIILMQILCHVGNHTAGICQK